MENKMITLKEGDICKIDCGTHGMNIEGPAIVVVIKELPVTRVTSNTEKLN